MPPLFAVTSTPLDATSLAAAVLAAHAAAGRAAESPGPGGVVTFLGLVRDWHQGRRVQRLEYEAFAELAVKSFARIATEAQAAWPGVVLGIHHREGVLHIGEASVAIVAASAHRGEAFAASRYAIERVKQIAPVWKHEYFDGGDVWVEGATADPDDEGAREAALARSCT